MLKNKIKRLLQFILGLRAYLFIFALFIIGTLRFNKKEKDFLFFVKKIAGTGLILDIGANIGVMTYYLSKRHKKSKIISIEPIYDNFVILQRVTRFCRLHNVQCKQLAVGDVEGTVKMLLPIENHVKMHGLCHVMTGDSDGIETGKVYEVPVKRIDGLEFIAMHKLPIIAIKMDVENFEYSVLKGAELTLKKDMPIIYCELWDNENRIKTIDFLKNLGYQTLVLQKKQLIPYNPVIHSTQNFFFLSENKA